MNYALITGASKGIGKAIAENLAQRGYNLLIVARTEQLLKENAQNWKKQYNVDIQYKSLDLEHQEAAQELLNWVESLDVRLQILVNNAGYGLWGNFNDLPLERQTKMLQINIRTVFETTHLFIPMLQKNKPAYILNTGSMAGLQAIPTVNAYSASKAFVNTFSRGLHHELKSSGVSVTVLVPGSVDTNFVEVSGMYHMEGKAKKTSMTAEAVANAAVKAMFKKKKAIIPGFGNKLMAFSVKHLPKSWIEQITGAIYKKK